MYYETTIPDTGTITTSNHVCGSWCTHWTTADYSFYFPTYKYLYQIFCPKKGCKEANWLELDTMKECTNCGSMLKAVSKKAEYEIEVIK